MAVSAPWWVRADTVFFLCEEEYVMEHVVITVEALRCYRCRAVMDPRAQCFQHELLTSVSEGHHGTSHTYALRDVCAECHAFLTQQDEDKRKKDWWWSLWMGFFMVNFFVAMAAPMVGLYPLYGALIVRGLWKWRTKRHQRLTPGQTVQQVPQTMAPSAAEEPTKSKPSS
jgi:hypothetical protein